MAVNQEELLEGRPWHTLTAEEVQRQLEAPPGGLTTAEAAARLERYGPNVVEAEKVETWWRLLLRQFNDPLIFILLIAAAVTAALHDYTDSGVILAVVILNAAIGFVQELRAREAIRGLARLSAPRAEVQRDGRVHVIESRDLVPGDVVLLASGARVPADIRLISLHDLELNESMLTGESEPVRKSDEALRTENLVSSDQLNMAFAGTVVTRGRGRGIVVRTGLATEIGRIATSIRAVGTTVTPLQAEMHRFGRRVGWAVGVLAVVVLIVGLLRGLSASEIFLTAVALAVSAIPEGLPVVMTVTLAIGVGRMARRQAIIRSLPAVETLGSTTVIGSDKTGTLTRNEMTVTAIAAGGRVLEMDDLVREPAALDEPLRLTLLAGVLANEADPAALEHAETQGDPTEVALLQAARSTGTPPSELRARHPEVNVIPFEPEQRWMATLNRVPGGTLAIFLKGAPEVVLERCDRQLTARGTEEPIDRDAAAAAARELGARGLRVLAMAYRAVDREQLSEADVRAGFVFLGAQGMEDPVRPEAVAAVRAAHTAGIRVLMLTGDHVDTARNVGSQLGLGAGPDPRAVEGRSLDALSDEELTLIIRDVDVYARVTPKHKLRLVQSLMAQGEIVAVTGDGVNDAPALRAAHLGIAMGKGGTDVAREASDMILADDNFATITAAIEEGRTIFGNVRKVAFFLLSTAVAEVITILVALLAGWPLPFIAAQILWINLVTNGLQDVALAFEKGEPGLLQRPPRKIREGIVTLRILERLGAVGIVLATGTLAIFWWTLDQTGDLTHARTMAMTQMVVFQFFHVFNCRSLDRSVFSIPLFSNRFLFISIITAAAAHAAVLHIGFLQDVFRTGPLRPAEWLLVAAIGSTAIIGGELDKWRNRKKGRLLG
ncbi:MAG TPA: HAD-IC family P-type ATPase [Longimicrobiales bacterium]|nr:HAD-IC family P-type ATPase [Longimicrobiales bacterium]